MPGPTSLLIPVGRPIDADGNIIVEGKGVAPTLRVPVTEETLFYQGDALLDTAIALLQGNDLPFGAGPNTQPGGPGPGAPENSSRLETTTPEPATLEPPAAAVTATTSITVSKEVTGATAAETPVAATPTAEVPVSGTKPVTDTAGAPATPSVTATPAAATSPGPTTISANTVTIVARSGRALVYAEPNRASRILGFVKNGEVLDLLEQSSDGQWVRVNFTGANLGGWVNVSFAKMND
jgi:hypothetical protein